MGGVVKRVVKAVSSISKVVRVANFLGNLNPFVALGVIAVGWLFMRSQKPDIPDFGTNDFEETERGILVNKQSNMYNRPIEVKPYLSTVETSLPALLIVLLSRHPVGHTESIARGDKTRGDAFELSDVPLRPTRRGCKGSRERKDAWCKTDLTIRKASPPCG